MAYCSFKLESDRASVGVGRNNEVVLELLLSVEQHVHTGIDILVFDFAEVRYISAPLLRIVSDEVVALAWQFVHADHLRTWCAVLKLHSQRGCVPVLLAA